MSHETPREPAHVALRRAAAERGWPAARAAKELGCTASYLSRVFRGEHTPSDPFRYRAERIFGVPAAAWDPRSIDRDALIRAGFRPLRLAKRLRMPPAIVLVWWRGGHEPTVAAAVGPILAGL